MNPVGFKKELEELSSKGLDISANRIRVDYRTHLTFPFHLALDEAREQGSGSLGTTKKGIGPTYSFKVDRRNVRFGDFFTDEKGSREILKGAVSYANAFVRELGGKESTLAENEALFDLIKTFKEYISFEAAPFYKLSKDKKCLLEGAQALGLDIDHGTYPYVTSSNAMPAMASVGAPFPMSGLGRVFGVFKAYMTRVGAGPFPTELDNEVGESIRQKGAEFGATTGRPRRVGWLDLDDLKKNVELSDVTDLVITKSDILSGEEKVILKRNNELVECAGWEKTEEGEKLTPQLDKYLTLIEEFVGVKITLVGTGSDRKSLFQRQKLGEIWN